jgi:predicted MFS family arabinose efflux permease
VETHKAQWYFVFIMMLAKLCHHIDRSIITILIEPIKAEFVLSDTQIGFMVGFAYAAAFVLTGIPIGMLADRINRKNLVGALLVIWGGLTVATTTVASYVGMIMARMGVAAAESGASPTFITLVSDAVPERNRSTALGILYMAPGIGAILTSSLGG